MAERAEYKRRIRAKPSSGSARWRSLGELVLGRRFAYRQVPGSGRTSPAQTTARHFLTTSPSGTEIAEHHHRYWRVDLRTPNHPRGYARASLLALGPAVPVGLLEGFTGPRVRDLPTTLRTADGTAHTRTGPVLAEATLPVDAASLEGPRDLLALRRFVGREGRFGVSLLPEEAGAPALSFWGHLATDGGLDHESGQMYGDNQQRGFHWLETLEVHEV